MKKFILVLVIALTSTFNLKAQDGLENILFADISDANLLTKEYLRPAAEGFIFSMNSGWYHTAKVHKTLGFDITISGSFASAPSSKELFNVSALNLSSKISASPSTSPTVVGSGVALANAFEVTIPANSDSNINGGVHPELKRSFTMPNGFKDDLPLSRIPSGALQFNLGLPWKLEASLRFIPKVGSDDTKGKLFGMGIKKEITSWFGPMEKTPLHVSLLAGFSNMDVSSELKDPSGNDINITNGMGELKINTYTFQALASLNFPVINIYGGFGYVSGSSSLDMKGTYAMQYVEPVTGQTFTRTITNPLSLDYDASGFTTTAGVRLSLGFFKVFANYTLQEYNTFSGGIAFGFR